MFQVKKRDGSLVEFDMSKISTALSKAFNAQQTNYTADILNMLTHMLAVTFYGIKKCLIAPKNTTFGIHQGVRNRKLL